MSNMKNTKNNSKKAKPKSEEERVLAQKASAAALKQQVAVLPPTPTKKPAAFGEHLPSVYLAEPLVCLRTLSLESGSVRGEPRVRTAWPRQDSDRVGHLVQTAWSDDSVRGYPEKADAAAWSWGSDCEQTERTVGATWPVPDASCVSASDAFTRAHRRRFSDETAAHGVGSGKLGTRGESQCLTSPRASVGAAVEQVFTGATLGVVAPCGEISIKSCDVAGLNSALSECSWERLLTPAWRMYLIATRARTRSVGSREQVRDAAETRAPGVSVTQRPSDDDDDDDSEPELPADEANSSAVSVGPQSQPSVGVKRDSAGEKKSLTGDLAPIVSAIVDMQRSLTALFQEQRVSSQAQPTRVALVERRAPQIEAIEAAEKLSVEQLRAEVNRLRDKNERYVRQADEEARARARAQAAQATTTRQTLYLAQSMLRGAITKPLFNAARAAVSESHGSPSSVLLIGQMITTIMTCEHAAATHVATKLKEMFDDMLQRSKEDTFGPDEAFAMLTSASGMTPLTDEGQRAKACAAWSWQLGQTTALMYAECMSELPAGANRAREAHDMCVVSVLAVEGPTGPLMKAVASGYLQFDSVGTTQRMLELLQMARATAASDTPQKEMRVNAVSYTAAQRAQYSKDRATGACMKCHQKGHLARDCSVSDKELRKQYDEPKRPKVRRVLVGEEVAEEVANATASAQKIEKSASSIVLILNGERQLIVTVDVITTTGLEKVHALIDTGAAPSMMNMKTARLLGVPIASSQIENITGIGPDAVPVLGVARLQARIGGTVMLLRALVVEECRFDILIGTDDALRCRSRMTIELGGVNGGGRVRLGRRGKWIQSELPITTNSKTVAVVDEGQRASDELSERAKIPIAVREKIEAISNETNGTPFQLPLFRPDAPVLPEGPPLKGVELTSYKAVNINPDLEASTRQQMERLVKEFADVFLDSSLPGARQTPPIAKSKHVARLEFVQGADFDNLKFRRMQHSAADKAILKKEREILLESGKIRRVSRAVPFASPAFVVRDHDDKPRMVIGFEAVNKILYPGMANLPLANDVISWAADHMYMNVVDGKQAFYQYPIDEASMLATAVTFEDSFIYEFCVVPMGLKSSPAIVQTFHTLIFDDAQLRVFVDDIYGAANTEKDIVHNARIILTRARENGVTLNAKKCYFGYKKLKVLGRMVSKDSIALCDDTVELIQNYGRPESKRALRGFLGLIAQAAHHLPNINAILAPLHKLAGGPKNGRLEWTPAALETFEAAKRAAAVPEILKQFDDTKLSILATDFAKTGMAAALLQMTEGKETFDLVGVKTHTCTPAQSNYGAPQGELEALLMAVGHWQHLLTNRKVVWLTDSQSIAAAVNAGTVAKSPKIARMMSELQRYDIYAVHIPGRFALLVDGASRAPLEREDEMDDSSPVRDQKTVASVMVVMAPLMVHDDEQPIEDDEQPIEVQSVLASAKITRDRLREGQRLDQFWHKWVVKATPMQAHEMRGCNIKLLPPVVRVRDDEDVDDKANPVPITSVNAVSGQLADNISATTDEESGTEDGRLSEPRLYDGVLWIKVDQENHWRVAVPRSVVRLLIRALHVGSTGVAHWNEKRVLQVAREFAYWPTMSKDIIAELDSCEQCQRLSDAKSRRPGNMGDAEADALPMRFEVWELDLFYIENRVFMAAIEQYSGLVIACQLPNQESASLTAAVEMHIVQPYGLMSVVIHDGGPEFKKNFQQWCLTQSVTQKIGLPYNSQHQSRVERAIRSLKDMYMVSINQRMDANVRMARAAREINEAPSAASGMSPLLKLLGRGVSTPLARAIESDVAGSGPEVSRREDIELQQEWATSMDERRQEERAQKRAEHERAHLARTGPVREVQIGDQVWVKLPPDQETGARIDTKLAKFGPYTVEKYEKESQRVSVKLNQLAGPGAVRLSDVHRVVHIRDTEVYVPEQPISEYDQHFGVESSVSLGGVRVQQEEKVFLPRSLRSQVLAPDRVARALLPTRDELQEQEEISIREQVQSREALDQNDQLINVGNDDEERVVEVTGMQSSGSDLKLSVRLANGNEDMIEVTNLRYIAPEIQTLMAEFRQRNPHQEVGEVEEVDTGSIDVDQVANVIDTQMTTKGYRVTIRMKNGKHFVVVTDHLRHLDEKWKSLVTAFQRQTRNGGPVSSEKNFKKIYGLNKRI